MWKSRNDHRFCRKEGRPHQVNMAATALLSNLEMEVIQDPVPPTTSPGQIFQPAAIPLQGTTAKTDFFVAGPKLYVDAAWKPNKNSAFQHNKAGLGVYCHFKHNEQDIDIFVHAIDLLVPSALSAEAQALLLAAKLAHALELSSPTFFTDCLSLARAAAASSSTADAMLWEIRKQVAEFGNYSKQLHASIFHIYREINRIAHKCAQQARRSTRSEPIFRCLSSAHTSDTCPTIAAVSNLQLSGIVLNVIYCLRAE